MWLLKKYTYSTKDDLLIQYEIVQKTNECGKKCIFKFIQL